MNNGWIRLYRQISDWEWYRDIKTKSLFFHLLIKARYKDGEIGGTTVKKGQVVTSCRQLADESGLTYQSVRTCLGKLVSSGEIAIFSTQRFTTITICNYNKYQPHDHDDQRTEDQSNAKINAKIPKNQRKDQRNKYDSQPINLTEDSLNTQIASNAKINAKIPKNQRKDQRVLKEVNKNNNIKNNKNSCCNFSPDSDEARLSILLADLILEWQPNNKDALKAKADPQKWALHIDRAHRLDNRTFDELEAVIRWAQQDEFWLPNILSTKKLRAQFDKLDAKMKTDIRNKAGPGNAPMPRTYAQAQDFEMRQWGQELMEAEKSGSFENEKKENAKTIGYDPDSHH